MRRRFANSFLTALWVVSGWYSDSNRSKISVCGSIFNERAHACGSVTSGMCIHSLQSGAFAVDCRGTIPLPLNGVIGGGALDMSFGRLGLSPELSWAIAHLPVQPSRKRHQTDGRRFPAIRPVGLVRCFAVSLREFFHEFRCFQVRVSFQHCKRSMPADTGNFHRV